jgi:hypothetical protein
VKTGRSCINFKKLEDFNLAEAMKLVKQAEKSGGINAIKETRDLKLEYFLCFPWRP